jgi:protein-disulfide isomerase/uncharacterized membrane protein
MNTSVKGSKETPQPILYPLRWLALVVAIIGFGLSIFLLIEFHTAIADPSHQSACDISATVSCTALARSGYSTVLGLPIAWYGVITFFLALYLVISTLWVDLRGVLFVIASAGILGSFALYGVSRFVAGVICPLCCVVYGAWFVLWLIFFRWNRPIGVLSSVKIGVAGIIRLPFLLLNILGTGVHSTLTLIGVLLTVSVGVATASLPVIVDFQPRGEPIAEYLSKFVSDWRSSPTQNIPEQVERDGKSDIADFVLGPDDAPVQIVEFADFECGACQAVYPQIEALLKEYRGVIRYSLRHFPLDISCNKRINRPMHLHACQLAELAQCAGAQSKFWEVVPILYKIGAQIGSDQSLLDPPLMGEFPGINLDREEFKRCIDSGSQRGVIAGDIDVADSLGLSGTPSFWINGRRVQRPNVEGIRAIIRSVVEEGKSRDR